MIKTVGLTTPPSDFTSLRLWEADRDAAGDAEVEEIASVTSDLADDFAILMTGWGKVGGTLNREVTIRSSEPGTKRIQGAGAATTSIFYVSDPDFDSFTFEDMLLDASSQTNNYGIHYVQVKDMTLNRVHIRNTFKYTLINDVSATETLTCNNCIFENARNTSTSSGVDLNYVGAPNTVTFTNCLFVNNYQYGLNSADNANISIVLNNCIGMGNNLDAFRSYTNTSTTVLNCVTDDSSATDTGHSGYTTSVSGKTDTSTAVFLGFANGDYRLSADDIDSWGIEGDDAATPATDIRNYTRSANTIGPYEFQNSAYEALESTSVAHFRLDETANAIAYNQTGTDGTYVGSPTLGATGLADHTGTAVTFAASDYVTATGLGLDDADQSISFWIKGQDASTYLVAIASGIEIYQSSGANSYALGATLNGSTAGAGNTTHGVHATNAMHVVVVFTALTNDLQWYIDGVAGDTQTPTGTILPSGNFIIGAQGTPPGSAYAGDLDEVLYFDKVLTQSDVSLLYTGAAATGGGVAASAQDTAMDTVLDTVFDTVG